MLKFFDSVWKRGRGPSYHQYVRNGPEGLTHLRDLRSTLFGDFSTEDIAFAIQHLTEKRVCSLIKKYKDQYPEYKNIVVAGGVFANVKINMLVKQIGFENIFVQPAMSDAGLSLGAALCELNRLKPNDCRVKMDNVYLRVGFSNEEIEEQLKKSKHEYKFYSEDEIAGVIAQFIEDDKVIAHFNGRMEYGPRALGNRTILYKAADVTVNDWLNKRLNRTEFMPFAPAVKYEAKDEYFINIEGAEKTAEFMTYAATCTERAQKEIPAAVHVDNTARPQLVRREVNPRFWNILNEFEKISGVPSCINTSFNMHEEPIVATPEDALRSFDASGLDVLILGNYVVRQPTDEI
jgi:carbamoyltransferase